MASSSNEEQTWEETPIKELQKLQIKADEPQQLNSETFPVDDDNKSSSFPEAEVDSAVLEALTTTAERKTVFELEDMVIDFIGDTSRDILEFSPSLGTFQKMLAHRVAQAYGLQTSTVDYEEGPGRVVGTRTQYTRLRKVKLSKLDANAAMAERVADRSGNGGPAPSKILRRPQGPEHGGLSPSSQPGSSAPSIKEREEDYHRARERIIGPAGIAEPPMMADLTGMNQAGTSGNLPSSPFSTIGGNRMGGYGGRGAGISGPPYSGRESGGRGRGRKAVLRDKDRELQDPDYMRRDGHGGVYDPRFFGGYPEGYQDFSRQPMHPWGGMPQPYRTMSSGNFPPPPPPLAKGSQPHSPQYPNSPVQSGMPMLRQGSGGTFLGSPGGMPMSPYPIPGYPGTMGYPTGMPVPHQAMYAAAAQGMGYPYPGIPMTGGGPQGPFPMYPGAYAMYPSTMTSMPMQPGARPMPGMEQMYFSGVAMPYGGITGSGGYMPMMGNPLQSAGVSSGDSGAPAGGGKPQGRGYGGGGGGSSGTSTTSSGGKPGPMPPQHDSLGPSQAHGNHSKIRHGH
ncbi:hypothetical protein CEUSTIGMA_g6121.t1 [Chlamydomonas eustigma]|uniref:R3H domain-containing protein n=1 Tax=Chlamydomonas eustigma TaxID=1157962 RepID=A0A250X6H7_9CHLO|nr:hypothetical protein CEUSTIGMA_g6121.t1 [Chlamydomonas eustigma]|eukprot:GAX78683.1 hypothetical protein CEUSTIGMA_g6121.t1 [Chlamydomonas eustigma]